MKKTGRAMRLDINHRRSKILTLSKGTSASALSSKYVRTYKNQSPSPLTRPASLEMLKYVWSAARVQEEFDGTRSSLRKCIRPLVENGLRAHDDDPRVPVLVNPDGHEKPVFQRRFSGTPFDCFFVLPVLLQTSGKRTSKSLRLAGNREGSSQMRPEDSRGEATIPRYARVNINA